MNKSFDNKPEDFLENISEELGTISGTCAEIKEAQLNGATVNDVEKVGNDVKTAITEKFGELHDAITEPWGILNNLCNRMDDNTRSSRETVQDAEERLCEKFDDMKDGVNEKFDSFLANPPEQKVVHRIARESWQWYTALGFSLLTCVACVAMFFWQEARIEQCRISDVKYHYIMMHNGVGSVGLDSIESWFRDPAIVRSIEREVRQYEQRVAETARALEQKHRLEEKLKELNNSKN